MTRWENKASHEVTWTSQLTPMCVSCSAKSARESPEGVGYVQRCITADNQTAICPRCLSEWQKLEEENVERPK